MKVSIDDVCSDVFIAVTQPTHLKRFLCPEGNSQDQLSGVESQGVVRAPSNAAQQVEMGN